LNFCKERDFWGETRLRFFNGEGIKGKRDSIRTKLGHLECSREILALENPESEGKKWSVGIEQEDWEGPRKISVEYLRDRYYGHREVLSFAAKTMGRSQRGPGNFFQHRSGAGPKGGIHGDK